LVLVMGDFASNRRQVGSKLKLLSAKGCGFGCSLAGKSESRDLINTKKSISRPSNEK
jgi:hypothetical protein